MLAVPVEAGDPLVDVDDLLALVDVGGLGLGQRGLRLLQGLLHRRPLHCQRSKLTLWTQSRSLCAVV